MPSRRFAFGLFGAALLSLTTTTALAKKGGGGKPGGGGEDPPPPPAPVEYQLTWIPGVNGGNIRIYDSNSAGIAVGSYADETGTAKAFWTTADGVINPLWWTLPPGYEAWRVGSGGILSELQISEGGLVCGVIGNDETSEYQLFLADFSDPNSLEPVGSILSRRPRYIHMNEFGDVACRVVIGNDATLYLYVASLDKMFGWEQNLRGFTPTGINDNLQVSLVYQELVFDYPTYISSHGSGLLTFDVATKNGEIEDLGIATASEDPVTLAWGGLNNAGDVFGCFETRVSRVRYRNLRLVSRVADTTAGFIAADSATWTELDSRLPSGSTMSSSPWSFTAAACALGVNEAGQVVGGYNKRSSRYFAEGLWLLDPEDGLFDVENLVVGDIAQVDEFRSANQFGDVRLTEPTPETGYGVISGWDSSYGAAFILTPHLVQQP